MSKRSPPPTLYRRTLTSLLLAVALTALIGGILGSRALERRARAALVQSLATEARLMEPQVRDALERAPTIATVQPLALALGQRASGRVTIVDANGTVLGDSEQAEATVPLMENHAQRPEVQTALSGQLGTSFRFSETVRQHMLYVAAPVTRDERLLGVVRVAVPVTVVAELQREIRRTVLVSALIGFLLAAGLGAWFARRLTQPLARLIRLAQAYARGELSANAQHDAPIREVRQLHEALTQMALALQERIGELTTERNQASAILDSVAEGVIALDPQGRVLLLNPAARRLLELSPKAGVGQALFEVVRSQEIQDAVGRLLKSGQRVTKEVTLFHPRERILRVHGVPCEGCGAGGPCAVLVIQDVTETHRYEQLRREFVANVSHELKSPLTSIRSLTETLLTGALEDRTTNQRFVQLIDEDAGRLSRLIEDLLSLSQIESQPMPVRRERVALRPLVESVLEALAPAIAQRRLRVRVEVEPALVADADPERLRQVLTNLLDNAVKYNREGGAVTVRAGSERGDLRVDVADTGIGIPDADLPRIFERFYRVDKARSRELGGTGLGLSIVKHIIEAHGGAVSVTSHLQQGSTFSFTLPLQP